MKKCYEYYNCHQTECIARVDDRHCWQVESTLCYKEIAENNQNKSKKLKYKKSICDHCPYRDGIFKIKNQ